MADPQPVPRPIITRTVIAQGSVYLIKPIPEAERLAVYLAAVGLTLKTAPLKTEKGRRA